jgi:hypothetical protein
MSNLVSECMCVCLSMKKKCFERNMNHDHTGLSLLNGEHKENCNKKCKHINKIENESECLYYFSLFFGRDID